MLLLFVAVPLAGQAFAMPDRLEWAARSSVSTRRLASVAFTSAIRDHENYVDSVRTRFVTGAAERFGEASLGALWSEDPRYPRWGAGPVRARLWNAVRMSVMVRDTHGLLRPATARFIAVPAVSVASNAWRPEPDRTWKATTTRIPLSFAGRAFGNVVSEFGPDLWRRVRGR